MTNDRTSSGEGDPAWLTRTRSFGAKPSGRANVVSSSVRCHRPSWASGAGRMPYRHFGSPATAGLVSGVVVDAGTVEGEVVVELEVVWPAVGWSPPAAITPHTTRTATASTSAPIVTHPRRVMRTLVRFVGGVAPDPGPCGGRRAELTRGPPPRAGRPRGFVRRPGRSAPTAHPRSRTGPRRGGVPRTRSRAAPPPGRRRSPAG